MRAPTRFCPFGFAERAILRLRRSEGWDGRIAARLVLSEYLVHAGGKEAVRSAVADAIARYRGSDGSYPLENIFRSLLAGV